MHTDTHPYDLTFSISIEHQVKKAGLRFAEMTQRTGKVSASSVFEQMIPMGLLRVSLVTVGSWKRIGKTAMIL